MNSDFSRLRFAIYARKSTTSDDRQVLSIESQLNELRSQASTSNYQIVHEFIDSASAHKVDNRPSFMKMQELIEEGKIDGILTWKADRLARNPKEGANIIHLLQENTLKIIQTPYCRYLPTDNMLPLYIEFGMANQYSLDLSKNVKRGNKTKIEKGGHCGVAPHGYINDMVNKTVVPDPERFDLVKEMWQLYLTGNYSLNKICTIANNDWGFRTIRRTNQGGKKLSVSSLYKILANPFYFGIVHSGDNRNFGVHKPMISQAEFEKVQTILQRQGRKGEVSYEFPLTGFIKCGECGGSITAEEKVKYKCPKCKKQLSAKRPAPCRHCRHPITKKVISKGKWYTYYRCSKKVNHDGKQCQQKFIRDILLEAQFISVLKLLDIDTEFEEWTIKWIKSENERLFENKQKTNKLIMKNYTEAEEQVKNLVLMRANKEISLEEFEQYHKEAKEKRDLWKAKLNSCDNQMDNWVKNAIEELEFINGVRKRFENGSIQDKKYIFSKIGSNFFLYDGKLSLDIQKPYLMFKRLEKSANTRLEPFKFRSVNEIPAHLRKHVSIWLGQLEEIRTFFEKNDD